MNYDAIEVIALLINSFTHRCLNCNPSEWFPAHPRPIKVKLAENIKMIEDLSNDSAETISHGNQADTRSKMKRNSGQSVVEYNAAPQGTKPYGTSRSSGNISVYVPNSRKRK